MQEDTTNDGPAMTTEDVTGVESNPSPDNLTDAAVAEVLDAHAEREADPNNGEATDVTDHVKSFTVTDKTIQSARDALHEWVDTIESVFINAAGHVEVVGGKHHLVLINEPLADALMKDPPSLIEDEPEHRVKDKARQRR